MPPADGRQLYLTQFHGDIQEMPTANCGFRVAHGISRNFVGNYGKWPLRTADSALSATFRAIKLRDARDAVSELWISRCPWFPPQSLCEIRVMPPPNCGCRVVNSISRIFVEKYERRRLQSVGIALPMVIRATSSRFEKCRL